MSNELNFKDRLLVVVIALLAVYGFVNLVYNIFRSILR